MFETKLNLFKCHKQDIDIDEILFLIYTNTKKEDNENKNKLFRIFYLNS